MNDNAMVRTSSSGVVMIAQERNRQVTAHGFDGARDDQYVHHELVSAAVHYALNDGWGRRFWPSAWDARYDQKANDDRITQLAKAGALIAAEIDRLLRAPETPER